MNKAVTSTVQQWGNSLAVRIPAAIARSAHFSVGQPVEVSADDSGVQVKPIGTPKLTLAQKLAAFDPAKHGGEAMAIERIGAESFNDKQEMVPDRRDIIWIDCNPQLGREMKDIHPLLVLSPKAFNERTGIVIGLPMTTAEYNDTNPFAVKYIGQKNVASYILGHQPKSFDWRMRKAKPHPMKQAPEDVFSLACQTLNQIISIGE